MKAQRSGFTLIELMISIAIAIALAALIFIVAGPMLEKARQRTCMSNLHQIGLALSMYRNDYDGADPVIGEPMSAVELGLPPPTWLMPGGGVDRYLKSRKVLFCPDEHEANPGRISSYGWSIIPGGPGIPTTARFSYWIGQRGGKVPIVTCDQHNALDSGASASLPRWKKMRVIVLRLDGAVDNELVPVRTTPFAVW